MKTLIASTLAIMILAGGVGTFRANDADFWGTDHYWEHMTEEG